MVNSISLFWVKYLFANASTRTLQGHTTNASVKIIFKTSACCEILINNTQSCYFVAVSVLRGCPSGLPNTMTLRCSICALVLMKTSAITLTAGQLQLLQQDLLLAVRAVSTIHAMRILPSFQLYQFAYHRAIFCLTWCSAHSLIASPSLTPGRRPGGGSFCGITGEDPVFC